MDERILERVRRLLAIAHDEAASPNEQMIALERAQRLIDRHAIEQWELERGDPGRREPVTERRIPMEPSPVNRLMNELLATVAHANRCRSSYEWYKARNGRPVIESVTLYGTRADIENAETIWTGMETSRALMWRIHARRTPNAKENAAFRDGYYNGFAHEIARRYAALERDMGSTTTGTELILARRRAVDEYMDTLTWSDARPRFRKHRVSRAAYRMGTQDAANQQLGLKQAPGNTGARTVTDGRDTAAVI